MSDSNEQVLSNYYAAMNAHDVVTALTFLHPDVIVTFPEEDRNWKGTSVANEKFSGMFQRMPSFTGSFEVLSRESIMSAVDGTENGQCEAGIEKISVACRFQCVQSGSDSGRNMTYLIQNCLITEINHL
jgi:ketosteroid isomerase-like protein